MNASPESTQLLLKPFCGKGIAALDTCGKLANGIFVQEGWKG
jgi:hypothetical protein